MTRADKPLDHADRRAWQDAARARGDVPECGRMVCRKPADPAWVTGSTPLLHCPECAALVNEHTPGLYVPEVPTVAVAAPHIGPRPGYDFPRAGGCTRCGGSRWATRDAAGRAVPGHRCPACRVRR